MNKPTANQPKERTVMRFSPDVFNSLVKTLPKCGVSSTTTAHEAGFQLGIQFVLQKLREGFVHEAG